MMQKDWYSPGQVTARYTRAQVRWLIPHLPLLRGGSYPRNPKETGYVDPGIGRPDPKPNAAFTIAADIAAEIDLRIQRAGPDGLMLEFLHAFEPDDELFIIEHMAQALNMGTREVSQRIKNALYYVSGSGRKATSYKQYIKDNHRYLKRE